MAGVFPIMGLLLAVAPALLAAPPTATSQDKPAIAVHGFGEARAELLAAKEARRYLHELLLVGTDDDLAAAPTLTLHADSAGGDGAIALLGPTPKGSVTIVTATYGHAIHASLRAWDATLGTALDAMTHRDAHLVHSLRAPNGGTVVVCAGSTPRATLYAAYSLAELLGARFHLHGDVSPHPSNACDI